MIGANRDTGPVPEPGGGAGVPRGEPHFPLTMTVTAAPSGEAFRTIFQALDAFNAPFVGHARFVPLAVLIHDEAGEVNGGLWGWTVYSWLCINMLFVPESLRYLGL